MTDKEIVNQYRVKHPGQVEKLEAEVSALVVLMGKIVEQMCAKYGPDEGRKKIIELQRLMQNWQSKQ